MTSVSIQASDSRDIARCFDANGDITYSDVLCVTFENDNPLLMKEDAVQRHIRNRKASTSDTRSIASVQLSTVTNEAIDRCQKHFAQYFKQKYHTASEVPPIRFDQLVDQYNKGSNVSISALGTTQYHGDSANHTLNIECTAQKLGPDARWQVGFRQK
ncbi:hypothetical protein [Kaarinaea lacus]